MTRRDYLMLAAALKSGRITDPVSSDTRQAYTEGMDVAARMIAASIENVDPCFDGARFLKNAGVNTP